MPKCIDRIAINIVLFIEEEKCEREFSIDRDAYVLNILRTNFNTNSHLTMKNFVEEINEYIYLLIYDMFIMQFFNTIYA